MDLFFTHFRAYKQLITSRSNHLFPVAATEILTWLYVISAKSLTSCKKNVTKWVAACHFFKKDPFMSKKLAHLNKTIHSRYPVLTKKGKKLADYVLTTPDKAVFMTTRELAAHVEVSEATVVRFVRQLGYPSYGTFIKALRELIDTELTLTERSRIDSSPVRSDDAELERITNQDIENIKSLSKSIDIKEVKRVRKILKDAESVNVIGSRLSYSSAFYLGWSMAKVRENVRIYKGSDKTTMDSLLFSSKKSVNIIVATSRYPNDLIQLGKFINRRKFPMILLTDSQACPLAPMSDYVLVAPLQSIPFLGNPASMISLITYLVHSLAVDMGEKLKIHQEKLEQAYLENDILFYY